MAEIKYINTKEPNSTSISILPFIIYEKVITDYITFYNITIGFWQWGIELTWKRKTKDEA
jgi:hypothetical protein